MNSIRIYTNSCHVDLGNKEMLLNLNWFLFCATQNPNLFRLPNDENYYDNFKFY